MAFVFDDNDGAGHLLVHVAPPDEILLKFFGVRVSKNSAFGSKIPFQ